MQLHYRYVGPAWKRWLGLGSYVTTDWCACETPFCASRTRTNSHGSRLWPSGKLLIPSGTPFSPTGPVPDTDAMVGASLFHDELYLFGREGRLAKGWRAKADALLARHMWRTGIGGKVYAPIAWAGVRVLYWPARLCAWVARGEL